MLRDRGPLHVQWFMYGAGEREEGGESLLEKRLYRQNMERSRLPKLLPGKRYA